MLPNLHCNSLVIAVIQHTNISSDVGMQDPDLFSQLNQSMSDVSKLQPLNDNIEQVLKTFYNFNTPEVSSPHRECSAWF